MTRDLRGTMRADAVDPASWTAPSPSPFRGSADARGVEARRIRVGMGRATRPVIGATVTAARHTPEAASRAADDVSRGVGETGFRVADRPSGARGRS